MTLPSNASATITTAIRFANTSDARELARLRYALRASTGTATEPEAEFLERCAAWMKERLADSHAWHCWVAEENGRLVGALWIQLVEKIPNPRSEPEHHAYLTNFYVHESARGKNIGATILAAAIEWCRTRDVHEIILWPTERSRSLYQRHGFSVRGDIMELIIDEPDQ